MSLTYVAVPDPSGDSAPILRLGQLRYTKCSCGSTHESAVVFSEEQARLANRIRVRTQTYTSGYPEGTESEAKLGYVYEDAWAHRTLNLDGLLVNGRI